jgi:phage tail-like protein
MTVPTTSNGAAAMSGVKPALGELNFSVKVQGRTVGRFAECSGLSVEYDVTDYVEGGNNVFVHKLRGGVRYPNVTLRRGVTEEDELLRWFYETGDPGERPTVTVFVLDPLGKSVRHFALSAAVPVRWTGPSVTSESSKAATESLEIAHEGFV